MTWLRDVPYIHNRNTEGRLMTGTMPPRGGTAARIFTAMGLPAKRDRRMGRLITYMMENKQMTDERKPILCLDFDGVCHSYISGWQGANVIPDDAVLGLFDFLEKAAPYFDIQVFSSRSDTPEGRDAMALWFLTQRMKWRESGGGVDFDNVISVSFPEKKPAAFISIDDRCLTFNGIWPDIDSLLKFKPWYKRK